jgi:methylmalonyl-CoA mutase N-terminal domain/subunit
MVCPLTKIGGTIQNDMLKEFTAQKTFMYPPGPSVKLISDTVEFGTNQEGENDTGKK